MTEEKMKDKIRKLMALGKDEGATEAEQALALERAAELMLKYNIEHVEEVMQAGAIWGERKQFYYKGNAHFRRLANSIAYLYNARQVIYSHDGTSCFVGFKENVEATEETLERILEQLRTMYKRDFTLWRKRQGRVIHEHERGPWRDSYFDAAAIRIGQRVHEIIEAQRIKIVNDKRALMVVNASDAAAEALLVDLPKAKPPKVYQPNLGSKPGWEAGGKVKIQNRIGGE